jgi:hypothetical protein
MQLSSRKRLNLKSVAIVWCGFVVADAADLMEVAGVCCPHLLAKEQTTARNPTHKRGQEVSA